MLLTEVGADPSQADQDLVDIASAVDGLRFEMAVRRRDWLGCVQAVEVRLLRLLRTDPSSRRSLGSGSASYGLSRAARLLRRSPFGRRDLSCSRSADRVTRCVRFDAVDAALVQALKVGRVCLHGVRSTSDISFLRSS